MAGGHDKRWWRAHPNGAQRRGPGPTLALGGLALLAALGGCTSTTSQAVPADTTRTLTIATPPTAAPTTTTILPTAPLPAGVSAQRGVVYRDGLGLDVYVPSNVPSSPGPWPTVVVFGGRASSKATIAPLAGAIASKGAVVYVPDYEATSSQPGPLANGRCAISYARATAAAHGGDPARLVLVGVTWGALPALGEALGGPWQQAAAASPDCAVPVAPTPAVAGVVSIVGQYDYYGTAAAEYGVYSPFSQLAADPTVPIRLIQGQVDQLNVKPELTESFRAAAAAAGHTVTVRTVDAVNLSLLGLRFDTASKTITVAGPGDDHRGLAAATEEVLAAASAR